METSENNRPNSASNHLLDKKGDTLEKHATKVVSCYWVNNIDGSHIKFINAKRCNAR